MFRKPHREEQEFGSDSFLDVLANLVGILIILIVVVGIRVAKMPPEQLMTQSEPAISEPVPAPEPTPIEAKADLVRPIIELPSLPEFAPLPEIRPTEEMLRTAAELKSHYDALQSEKTALDEKESGLSRELADGKNRIEAMQKTLSQSASQIDVDRLRLETLEQDVTLLRRQIVSLQEQADAIDNDQAPVEKLKHFLPPIGRVVSGDEVHFRLHGNRVSYVPLDELVREVKMDMERRKEILLNRSFFQGATRPINGYIMEYVLQRETASASDYSRGLMRIGVSNWLIKPTGPFKQETADEASRSGSHFLEVLGRHGPTTTVTFWVYPDSFDAHQKLKAMTHDAGYWVASRPLPTGVPIAGSPQGSKSVAQ